MRQSFEVRDKAIDLLTKRGAPWSDEGPRRLRGATVQGLTILHREPFRGATFGPDFFLKIQRSDGEVVFHVTWYDEDDEPDLVKFEAGDWEKILDDPSSSADAEHSDDIPY